MMSSSRVGFPFISLHSLIKLTIGLLAIFALLGATGVAQQQPQTSNHPRADSGTHLTIPAGTHLALVLAHPVDSRAIHRGDEINAQTTAPVTVGSQVVVPPGTFVQGKVEKLTRQGNRGIFVMQSLALVFPDGYVGNIPGQMTIESGEGTAWRNPGKGAQAGAVLAPLAGFGLGAAVGSAVHSTHTITLGDTVVTTDTHKGLAIGTMVGGAAGGIVSILLLARSRDFYVEVGAPMDVTLTQPVTFTPNQANPAGTSGSSESQ